MLDITNALRRINPNLNTIDDNLMNYLAEDFSHRTLHSTQLGLITEGQNFYVDDRIFITFNDYITEDLLNWILITNTNLGELPDNLPNTILNRIKELNHNVNINFFIVENIRQNSATIRYQNNNGDFSFLSYLNIVTFTLNYKDKHNLNKINNNKIDNNPNLKSQLKTNTITKLSYNSNSTLRMNSKINKSSKTENLKKVVNVYNKSSKTEKQQKLNEINQQYKNLSEDNKKVFKDKLTVIGTSAIGAGISAVGTKITVSSSAVSTSVSAGTEAIEMTPLLSEGGLAVAETLSVAEGTAVVATEGAVIGAEAGTAVALAPETLGLSLVIGGLAIAGTAIIWWLTSHEINTQAFKHESHNQYNEIEKYYKFLSHDQLKLNININEWNKIKQIYQENSNNYQEFKNKIKSEITNFHKEEHSGWGGSITDNDINTLINILYNHFQEINNHFSSNPNHGWKILTNTIGSYFIIEEE